jgi:nicotinamidase-related amidase
MNTHLIVIDPQNDFCDPKRGALYVKNAEKDMEALAKFITRRGDILDEIHVTLDSHSSLHIAHPIFWQNSKGEHPAPFTTITRGDVESGKWTPTNPKWMKRGLEYVAALERNKRYQLMIWPPHCLIGSWGHGIFPIMSDALIAWEQKYFAKVNYLVKGSNILTEHYSAVRADVPDDEDETTKLNTSFIDTVKQADRIYTSGEALSHCLASTMRDVAEAFGEENVKKFVLLRNSTSSVGGCEALGETFIKEMTKRGMKVMDTTDVKK